MRCTATNTEIAIFRRPQYPEIGVWAGSPLFTRTIFESGQYIAEPYASIADFGTDRPQVEMHQPGIVRLSVLGASLPSGTDLAGSRGLPSCSSNWALTIRSASSKSKDLNCILQVSQ